MNTPNFLIIGAQKSGTTTLARILSEHPDVFIARRELHFFDKEYNFSKGLDWYKQNFESAGDRKAVGEKTPDYLWVHGKGAEGHLPNVHVNIANSFPAVKLIAILREPVARAISAANHVIRTGRVSPLIKIDDLLVGRKRSLLDAHGVIDKGRYYRQISAYLKQFSRTQLLILFFEDDIVGNINAGLKKVYEFLDIDPTFEYKKAEKQFNRFNASKPGLVLRYYFPYVKLIPQYMDRIFPYAKAHPSQSTINVMREFYMEDKEKLFNLLGYRPASWL